MESSNHDGRAWMPAYVIAIQIVTTLLLGIRLLARHRWTNGKLGLDDLFVTIAWVLATTNAGVVILFNYKYDLGHHIWDVPFGLWSNGAELSWIITILLHWSTTFTKISVLLFYRRLASSTFSTRFIWAIWACIIFVIVYAVAIFVFLCSLCTPLEAEWRAIDSTFKLKWRCIPGDIQYAMAILSAIISLATDCYSILLPALLLVRIKVTARQQMGLIFIFGLSSFVVIAGTVRAFYFVQIQDHTKLDKIRLVFNCIAAGIAEASIGIVCACAPSVKSCFRVFFQERVATLKRKTSRSDLVETESGGTQVELSRTSRPRGEWIALPDRNPVRSNEPSITELIYHDGNEREKRTRGSETQKSSRMTILTNATGERGSKVLNAPQEVA